MKMLKRGIALLCVLVCFAFPGIDSNALPKKSSGKKQVAADSVSTILFIGNSLTYTNDLPKLVEKIGRDSGVSIKTEMLAFPDFALVDHWDEGKIQKRISDKQFDFVVVQQGPSSQQEGRALLLDYVVKIKALCDNHNSRLAVFMVWPAYSNYQHFDKVIQNYTEAATVTNSLLCPVGQVWQSHFSATNDFSYYGPDWFHPSKTGSENAALVIFHILFR